MIVSNRILASISFVALLTAATAPPPAKVAATAAPQSVKPPATGSVGMPKPVFMANIDREFETIDTNKDKKVSKAEMEQHRRDLVESQQKRRGVEAFTRLDVDKNGVISQQEFMQSLPPAPKINVEPLFTRIDGNRDQFITAAEYRAGAASEFERRDVNKDGMLSTAETGAVRK